MVGGIRRRNQTNPRDAGEGIQQTTGGHEVRVARAKVGSEAYGEFLEQLLAAQGSPQSATRDQWQEWLTRVSVQVGCQQRIHRGRILPTGQRHSHLMQYCLLHRIVRGLQPVL